MEHDFRFHMSGSSTDGVCSWVASPGRGLPEVNDYLRDHKSLATCQWCGIRIVSFIAKAELRGHFVRTWEQNILGRTVFYLNVRPLASAQSGAYTALCTTRCYRRYQRGVARLGLMPEAIQD